MTAYKKSKKHFSVMMQDEDVYTEFRKFVIRKWGKLHTVLAQEVEQALKDYMLKDVVKNTLNKGEDTKNNIDNNGDRDMDMGYA